MSREIVVRRQGPVAQIPREPNVREMLEALCHVAEYGVNVSLARDGSSWHVHVSLTSMSVDVRHRTLKGALRKAIDVARASVGR